MKWIALLSLLVFSSSLMAFPGEPLPGDFDNTLPIELDLRGEKYGTKNRVIKLKRKICDQHPQLCGQFNNFKIKTVTINGRIKKRGGHIAVELRIANRPAAKEKVQSKRGRKTIELWPKLRRQKRGAWQLHFKGHRHPRIPNKGEIAINTVIVELKFRGGRGGGRDGGRRGRRR